MIKQFVTAAVLGLTMAATASAQQRVAIGTGGTGGVFYAVGAGMADVINRNLEGTTANAEVTGASVENVRRVSMGEMLIGFSSASTLYAGKNGEEPFDEPQSVAAIAYLYPAWLQIAATAASGARTVEDLADLRVGIGPPGSNSSVLAERVLRAYDAWNEENIQFLSYSEATGAIKDGNIDASFVLAGVPASALIELTTTVDTTMIPVDPDRVSGLLDEFPFYRVVDIPAGTYEGQDEPVPAMGDPVILFTSADADEETVYNLTKTVFDNLGELAPVHPMAALISANGAGDTPIALHPGAERYLSGN